MKIALEVLSLFELSFNDSMFRAHTAYRDHYDPGEVQISTLSP